VTIFHEWLCLFCRSVARGCRAVPTHAFRGWRGGGKVANEMAPRSTGFVRLCLFLKKISPTDHMHMAISWLRHQLFWQIARRPIEVDSHGWGACPNPRKKVKYCLDVAIKHFVIVAAVRLLGVPEFVHLQRGLALDDKLGIDPSNQRPLGVE